MIAPDFIGPLLSFALAIFIATDASSGCDAQGQPRRSQYATDQQVREGDLLLAVRLNREHVIFLLLNFRDTDAVISNEDQFQECIALCSFVALCFLLEPFLDCRELDGIAVAEKLLFLCAQSLPG